MRWKVFATATCFACCAAAQTGTVNGTVRCADTGRPPTGIHLWLEPATPTAMPQPDPVTGEYVVRDSDQPGKRLLADVAADGQFTVPNVPAGTYRVQVYAPPYLSPTNTISPTSKAAHVATGAVDLPGAQTVQVHGGESVRLNVNLQRGGSIEGTVHLGKGAPALQRVQPPLGVAVNAERKLGPNQYARTGGAAHADGSGHYALEGLAPGDYILFFSGATRLVPTTGGSRGGSELPIYAPSTVRPDQATLIHIAGSETHHLDMEFPPANAMHHVEGAVVFGDAQAFRSALVRLYPKGQGGLTAAMPLSPTGAFTFESVPDGEYTIAIEIPPKVEFVSADVAHGEVRMRRLKAAYAETEVDVHVAGQNVAGILLQPTPAK